MERCYPAFSLLQATQKQATIIVIRGVLFTALFVCFFHFSFAQVNRFLDYEEKRRTEYFFKYVRGNAGNSEEWMISTIESVMEWAGKNSDKKLAWYAGLFKIVFVPSARSVPGDIIKSLLAVKVKYENAPWGELKASYYYFLSIHYTSRKDFSNALYYGIQSMDLMTEAGFNKTPLQSEYRYDFFRLCYQVGDYVTAEALSKDLLREQFNLVFSPFTLITLGWCI